MTTNMLSKCCNKPVRIEHGIVNFPDYVSRPPKNIKAVDLKGRTVFTVCTKCDKACDVKIKI